MKKITAIILVLTLLTSCLLLTGCNATNECEYDSLVSALGDIKDAVPDEDAEEDEIESVNSVTACIYGDDEQYYNVKVDDGFIFHFYGQFAKADSFSGKKVLSVTLSMQYEITFFDSGDAMIYYGFCNVFQSDRQYYKFKLNDGLDSLREYIIKNGTAITLES